MLVLVRYRSALFARTLQASGYHSVRRKSASRVDRQLVLDDRHTLALATVFRRADRLYLGSSEDTLVSSALYR